MSTMVILVSEKEVGQLSNGHKPRELLPDVIEGIMLEAEEEGEVLAMNDLTAMMHCSTATVTKDRELWETKNGKILPTGGLLHDMGKTTFTHKKHQHTKDFITHRIEDGIA